jgi:DNA-binding NarL/FixJ family response regulator
LALQRFGPNADSDQRILNQWYRALRNVASDPSVQALIRTHGRPRAFLRAEVADETVWTRSRIDDLLAESGIRDRLVAGVPLRYGVELLLVAYRREAQPAFGTTERNFLTMLASAVRDVGRTIARAHGLIDGRAPLAGREREVLRVLLLGLSEPEAAARLGLTIRSLHQYVVAIYQKLGVHSRGELMAHFHEPDRLDAALARYAPLLSLRELKILDSLVRGLSEKEIADLVKLSSRTVHHIVGTIYRKVGVRTRAALIALTLANSPDVF